MNTYSENVSCSEDETFQDLTPVMRIPKSEESNDNFMLLAMIYGFNSLMIVIPEERAILKEPLPSERFLNYSTQTKERNPDAILSLPRCWSFRLNCKKFFGVEDASWKDIETLTQSDLGLLLSQEQNTHLSLLWSHHGMMKHVIVESKEFPRIEVLIQHDGHQLSFVENGDLKTIDNQDNLDEMINKMWNFSTSNEVSQFCKTKFPKDVRKQLILLISFALNNLLLKTMRNEIAFN
jgi:hypothetical protein